MRLIDGDVLRTVKSIQSADFNTIETIQKWIDDAPTADVVEVVRCKDCKWYDKGENEVSTWSICTRTMGIKDSVIDTDYCSFAERKEESEVEE